MQWYKKRLELRDFGMALYLLSLVLPAVCQEEDDWLHGTLSQATVSGGGAFILGLPPVLYGYIAWLANPLFIAAYRTRTVKRSFIYALLALLMGLSVQLQLVTWYDEEGRFTVTGYTYGYYVWLLSFAWLAGLAITDWGKASVSTNVSKPKIRYGRWVFLLLLVSSIAFWHFASPVVAINFSPDSKEEFRYVWNTQDRIHRGDIRHGGSAVEFSHLFPGKDFFMMFDWWTDTGFQRCIDITPKWGRTIDIYLDETGRIDTTKTVPDVIARLKKCEGEPDPFRS